MISAVRGAVFLWFSVQCKGTENLLRRTLCVCVGGRAGGAGREGLSGPVAFPCISPLSPTRNFSDWNCSHFINGETEAERS